VRMVVRVHRRVAAWSPDDGASARGHARPAPRANDGRFAKLHRAGDPPDRPRPTSTTPFDGSVTLIVAARRQAETRSLPRRPLTLNGRSSSRMAPRTSDQAPVEDHSASGVNVLAAVAEALTKTGAPAGYRVVSLTKPSWRARRRRYLAAAHGVIDVRRADHDVLRDPLQGRVLPLPQGRRRVSEEADGSRRVAPSRPRFRACRLAPGHRPDEARSRPQRPVDVRTQPVVPECPSRGGGRELGRRDGRRSRR
jgi:hypothetical protein